MTHDKENALDIISQSLGAATGIVPLPRPSQSTEMTTEVKEAPEIEDDYNEARQNLKELISQAMESVPELVELARQTQSEKMYQALATFLTTAGNLNISMSKLSKEIKQPPKQLGKANPQGGETPIQQVTQNNTVFIGSTEEFLDMMEARKKANEELEVIQGECVEVKQGSEQN